MLVKCHQFTHNVFQEPFQDIHCLSHDARIIGTKHLKEKLWKTVPGENIATGADDELGYARKASFRIRRFRHHQPEVDKGSQ